MKFMRHTLEYRLLDHRRNEDILEEIRADPVLRILYRIDKNLKLC
jgi:hypothetical protein